MNLGVPPWAPVLPHGEPKHWTWWELKGLYPEAATRLVETLSDWSPGEIAYLRFYVRWDGLVACSTTVIATDSFLAWSPLLPFWEEVELGLDGGWPW